MRYNRAVPPVVPGYVVGSLLGRGGMGAVWRATHRSGLEVALKVVEAGEGTDATQGRFDDEARAVAALDHPHVVRVLDHGLLDAVGWLAMELADQGTLRERLAGVGATEEPDLIWVPALLSALAHAHARGVLNRDVKPANILFATDRAGRERLLLADFGIAQLGGTATRQGGTPAYMAPELFADQPAGPWSDLYAVGAVVWEALTGAPPHGHGSWDELAVAHRFGSLEGTAAGPVAAWARGLLARAPSERPVSAAAALETFPGARARTPAPALHPLPPDIGLGLLRLRGLPLRGRDRERARLAEALEEATSPRAVVLLGVQGMGKTRLARSFASSAEAAGRAVSGFSSDPGGVGRLGELLADLLGYVGALELGARASWLAAHPLTRGLAAPDRVDLARWLGGSAPGSAAERRDLVLRVLGGATAPRTLLVLDDAHGGGDALLLAEAALASDLPVLVVLTVRDDLVDPETRARIEALGPVLDVGPLDKVALAESLGAALPLDPGLVGEVVDHAAGSPLVAASLLADLGDLAPGPHGWTGSVRLDGAPFADALAEADAGDATAVAALLGLSTDRDEWRGLCAALDVPTAGVARRLADRGLIRLPPGRLVFAHAAIREAARARGSGLRARLIELLLARGERSGRLGRLLLADGRVAEAAPLLRAEAQDHRRQGDYRGCLARIRQREAAMAPLPAADPEWGRGWLVAAEAHLRLGDVARARELVEEASAAAKARDWPRVAVEADLRRGMLEDRAGHAERAHALIRDALTRAEAVGDARLAGQAREHLAMVAMRVGDYGEAERLVLGALAGYERVGQRHGVANCLMIAGVIAIKRGDAAAARPPLESLLAVATELGIRTNQGHAHTNLGEVCRLEGDLDAAERHYAAASEILGRSGSLHALFPRLNRALVQVDLGRTEDAVAELLTIGDELAARDRAMLEATVRLALLRCWSARQDLDRWDACCDRASDLLAATDELDREVAELAEKAGLAIAGARRRRALALAEDHWRRLGRQDDAERVAALCARV